MTSPPTSAKKGASPMDGYADLPLSNSVSPRRLGETRGAVGGHLAHGTE